MSEYLVFLCPRCGSIRYAKEGQSMAKCFGCSYQIPLGNRETKILLRTRRVEEAIEAVRKHKLETGFHRLL